MIVIKNKILPFKGFSVLNILGILFYRKGTYCNDEIPVTTLNHEAIHTRQQYEIILVSALIALVVANFSHSWWSVLLIVALPLLLYVIGFILEVVLPPYHSVARSKNPIKWLQKLWMDAYGDNCFEREAYSNEGNLEYLLNRKPFAWVSYIIMKRNG